MVAPGSSRNLDHLKKRTPDVSNWHDSQRCRRVPGIGDLRSASSSVMREAKGKSFPASKQAGPRNSELTLPKLGPPVSNRLNANSSTALKFPCSSVATVRSWTAETSGLGTTRPLWSISKTSLISTAPSRERMPPGSGCSRFRILMVYRPQESIRCRRRLQKNPGRMPITAHGIVRSARGSLHFHPSAVFDEPVWKIQRRLSRQTVVGAVLRFPRTQRPFRNKPLEQRPAPSIVGPPHTVGLHQSTWKRGARNRFSTSLLQRQPPFGKSWIGQDCLRPLLEKKFR
jgi:hypothetical protein